MGSNCPLGTFFRPFPSSQNSRGPPNVPRRSPVSPSSLRSNSGLARSPGCPASSEDPFPSSGVFSGPPGPRTRRPSSGPPSSAVLRPPRRAPVARGSFVPSVLPRPPMSSGLARSSKARPACSSRAPRVLGQSREDRPHVQRARSAETEGPALNVWGGVRRIVRDVL